MTHAFDNIHSRLEGMDDPAYIDDERTIADSVSKIINWVGGVIIFLLLARLILTFFGVVQNHIWVTFIYKTSYILAAPFFWLFNNRLADKSIGFESATLIAVVCYAVLIWLTIRILELLP